jgi:heterodisulfide reductase subunit A
MNIGVFICECGGNISNTVDVKKLCNDIKKMPEVKIVAKAQFLCSDQGLETIKKSIQTYKLDRIVIAACTPYMHEETFKNVISRAGLNEYLLEQVNIREQCSLVHKDIEKATEKAFKLIKGGIYKAKFLEPLTSSIQKIDKHALIIGGGITGIMSALQIANSGYQVTLIEKKPSIGGHMAQLSKTFPTLDCAPCILSPRMSEISKNPNIQLFTNAFIDSVRGSIGDFHVKVVLKPRGVDIKKCMNCGKCSEVCPVKIPNEFDEGLYERKAIYRPFPEAIPLGYVIDFENCKKCGLCVKACPRGAINLDEKESFLEINVGAIVIATGFDLIDLSKWKNYFALNSPNVITALQMERIMVNELAAGKVLKNESGERVKKIAYILCVGSRDYANGVSYCSKVCCPYTIKQAISLKKALPYLKIWIYYTDIRMSGRGFEEFYRAARELGINFIHGKPSKISINEGNKLEIIAEDRDSGFLLKNTVDMIVLAPALIPSKGTEGLAKKLEIYLSEDGFIAEKHPKLAPVSTHKEGVFVSGAASGPKDIRDSVADAQAAASQVVSLFNNGEITIKPIKPIVNENLCNNCGNCIPACPKNAISIKNNKIFLDRLLCNSCGACISSCERKAIEIANYRRFQLNQQIEGILIDKTLDTQILCFVSDQIAYSALDMIGTSRLSYPESIYAIRVPTTLLIDLDQILFAFAYGADGIVLLEAEESFKVKIIEKRISEIREYLKKYDIEKDRLSFLPALLPTFRAMSEQLTSYAKKIKALGKLNERNREKLKAAQLKESS